MQKYKRSKVSNQELIDKYVEFSEKHGYKYGAPMKVFFEQNGIYSYSVCRKRFGGLRKLKSIAYKDNFIIEVKRYCGVSSLDWMYYVNALSKLLDASPMKLKEISEISGIKYNHIKDRLNGDVVPRLNTFINIANAIGLRVDIKSIRINTSYSLHWEYYINTLRQLYNDSGITQFEISIKTGIAHPHISKFFSCKDIPQLDTFINIANALDAQIELTQPLMITK